PGAMLAGTTLNGCKDNVFSATNQALADAVCEWMRDHDSPLQFNLSNNMALPKVGFHAVGGFDPKVTLAAAEDRALCARWIGSGRKLVQAPDAQIDHFHPQTFKSFVRMHFRYGRGAGHLHRQRKTSPLQFVAGGLYWHMLQSSSRVRSSRLPATG